MTVTSMVRMALPGPVEEDPGKWPLSLARTLAPFVLIPVGALYCQIHEILFAERSTLLERLGWATATLLPWVIAVLVFEAHVAPGEKRVRTLGRALLLGLVAFAASSAAAWLLGAGAEQAFFSRIPLLAVALLCATLYPVPLRVEHAIPANENDPPVAPTDIVFASAAGNYVELHANGRTFIWRQTMHNAERILSPAGFVRVHRSYLVPWRSIHSVTRGRKGPIEVALHNGPSLPVSNRYAANLRH